MSLSDYKLFTDENIDPIVVAFLREQGFDVCDVKENNWFGRKDIDLMALAHQDQRVIITHDSDFGTLVFTRREPFTGLIYLRPGHFDAEPHIHSLKAIVSSSLELVTPFILIAENTGPTVKIRLRQL